MFTKRRPQSHHFVERRTVILASAPNTKELVLRINDYGVGLGEEV